MNDKGYQRSEITGYGLDNTLTEEKIKNDFKDILEAGEGIIIGISRSDDAAAAASPGGSPQYKGHMVRVVGYNDNGLIIDDPFGETDIVNFYTGGTRWLNTNSSSSSSSDNIHGHGITWSWSNIIQIRFRSVHRIYKQ